MNLLNRYFTPFAALLILSAAKVNWEYPDQRSSIKAAVFILAASVLVNWWFTANTYRFVGWSRHLRAMQIWLNFLWTVPLFHLLQFWGPMWLLFLMAPVTAALYQGLWQTLGTSLVSAATMLGLIAWRVHAFGGGEQGLAFWGMAANHALFIVVFSLFTHSLSQVALRLRDLPRS